MEKNNLTNSIHVSDWQEHFQNLFSIPELNSKPSDANCDQEVIDYERSEHNGSFVDYMLDSPITKEEILYSIKKTT